MVVYFHNFIYSFILAISFTITLYNLNLSALDKKNYIIFCGICILNFFISNILNNNITFPLYIITLFLYLTYCIKQFTYSIIILILISIIMCLADISALVTLVNLFNLSYSSIISNFKLYTMSHIVILIFSFIISKSFIFLLKLIKIDLNHINLYFKHKKSVVIYIALSLFIIYINGMLYKYGYFKHNEKTLLLILSENFIFLIISGLIINFTIKAMQQQNQYELNLKEFEQLKEYTSMVENVSSELKKFRHDYINILSTISGYIESNNMANLKEFFNKEIIPQNNSLNYKNNTLSKLKYIKVPGLKGLLSSKIITAQATNIDIFIDIEEDIDLLDIDIIDLCRILGIFMDNAIEACIGSPTKK